jgi:type VI secretion system secreted protein Hcp
MAAFLKFGTIKGESLAEGHKGTDGWIEIESVSWGCSRSITTPVGSSAKREASAPHVEEVSISKQMDSTSPMLVQELLAGKGEDATIELVQTSEDKLETYLQVKLSNALISAYSVASGGDRPRETISINFTKIEYTYSGFDDKHKLDASKKKSATFDVTAGKKG